MIDHLLLYGSDVEGIFRKSPKQQTVRVLRQQLDQVKMNMRKKKLYKKVYNNWIPKQINYISFPIFPGTSA
jgi:hypothetical protein